MDVGVDDDLGVHLCVAYLCDDTILTCSAFKPRLLLLIPSLTLILVLLHLHERSHPIPTLIGTTHALPSIGTGRVPVGASPNAGSSGNGGTYTTSTGADGETIPVVPPKETESGIDYYMNLQAIQNLMGLV
jgi:hypothetical protein